MPAAVLDSNVLIASLNDDAGRHAASTAIVASIDQPVQTPCDADRHAASTAIVGGIDRGVLPTGRVTNYVVAEVLNHLHGRHGHELALDTYERIERGASFEIAHETEDDFVRGVELFRTYDGPSFVDSLLVAYMNRKEVEYVYSFDDDFDALDFITRLRTDANPFGT